MTGKRESVLSAVFFLALSLYALRVVLPAPATLLAVPSDAPPVWRGVIVADQKLRVAQVSTSARALLHHPAHFFDGAQCYPVANALTLGEHEIGSALLGVVPEALAGEPVLTYNVVAVLTLVLPGIAMYLLVREWTASTAAALVAGVLFAVHPSRLGDLVHLGPVGNHWTPLALLFAMRLFATGSWGAAAGFALFASLQLLESIYPVIAFAIVGGTLGVWLVGRHVRRLPTLIVPIAAASVAVGGVVLVVYGHYFAMRAAWGTLAGRTAVLHAPAAFAPGGAVYPGTVLLLLAGAGLLDRMRNGPRSSTGDPRLALLVAGALAAWMATSGFVIPGTAIAVPPLFSLAVRLVPGLDAIRRIGDVVSALYLVLVVFAGYGVAALVRTRSRSTAAMVASVLVAAACAEVFVPVMARASFGRLLAMTAWRARPSDTDLELFGRMTDGAVLDVPYEFRVGRFGLMSDYALLGAYHRHPVAACYNSFHVPVHDDIAALASRVLTQPQAADALVALGIRNLVIHRVVAGRPLDVPTPETASAHLTEIGRGTGSILYRIESAVPVTPSFAPLATAVDDSHVIEVMPPKATIDVPFTNHTAATYRHPDPLVPSELIARWIAPTGAVREEHVRMLLPIALAAGERMVRPVTLDVPVPEGAYRLTIVAADQPDVPLAAISMRVLAAQRSATPAPSSTPR